MYFTLLNYASTINPPAGNNEQTWFELPTDIFALTSLILESTGWYRIVVESTTFKPLARKAGVKSWIDSPSWKNHLSEIKKQWSLWLKTSEENKNDTEFNDFLDHKRSFWSSLEHIGLSDLSKTVSEFIGDPNNPKNKSWKAKVKFVVNLIELNSVADQIASNYGINRVFKAKDAVREYIADSLLITTGSMSRVLPTFGVVLPKLRVPKVGLSIRSMSQNLCFVKTEVDISWRTFPWMNYDENSFSVLVIPIPRKIEPAWFKSLNETKRDSFDSARYFDYEPEGPLLEETVEHVIGLISSSMKSSNRVNAIVFPELSLSQVLFDAIKKALFTEFDYDQIPLIIGGLHSRKAADCEKLVKTNSVVISAFFAGKWYDLYQEKHHRWRMDSQQVDNYQLSGVLQGAGSFWENTTLNKRTLTFFSATGWLTLCPLICEDLARIEPVSKIIRSVGPNLLIAVLMDGPQLKSRWPARYATIFAEDPGTSVLTVTAHGMCKRSQPSGVSKEDLEENAGKIALWRDDSGNFSEIKLEDDYDAVLLSMEASMGEEITAHGISDNGAASSIKLRNVTQVRALKKLELLPISPNNCESSKPVKRELSKDFLKMMLNPADRFMNELSAFTRVSNLLMFVPNKEMKVFVGSLRDNIPQLIEGEGYKFKKQTEFVLSYFFHYWFGEGIQNNNSKKVRFLTKASIMDDLKSGLDQDSDHFYLAFSCLMIISLFDQVKSERRKFFEDYETYQKDNTNECQTNHRKSKYEYLSKLADICIDNLKIARELDGNNESGKELSQALSKLFGKKSAELTITHPLLSARLFQAANLMIIWGIHFHLSDTSVRNINSTEDFELIAKLQKASKLKSSRYKEESVKKQTVK